MDRSVHLGTPFNCKKCIVYCKEAALQAYLPPSPMLISTYECSIFKNKYLLYILKLFCLLHLLLTEPLDTNNKLKCKKLIHNFLLYEFIPSLNMKHKTLSNIS